VHLQKTDGSERTRDDLEEHAFKALLHRASTHSEAEIRSHWHNWEIPIGYKTVLSWIEHRLPNPDGEQTAYRYAHYILIELV
jgi:hypothetical protein